jgi:hypothetical protein
MHLHRLLWLVMGMKVAGLNRVVLTKELILVGSQIALKFKCRLK